MPIHKVSGGYKWGEHGATYPTREGAAKQAAAAYANGYKGYAEGGEVTGMNELHKKIIKQLLDEHMNGARGDMVKTILGHEDTDKDEDHPLNASKEKTENVEGEEMPLDHDEPELDAYGYPIEDQETPHRDSEDCKCKDCKAKR